MEMFKIAGEEYYFDLEKISDFIRMDEEKSIDDLLDVTEVPDSDDVHDDIPTDFEYQMSQGHMVDVTKWEMTKALVETVLNDASIVDEKMGITKLGEQMTIPFRLSFNTLLKNKLIRENE